MRTRFPWLNIWMLLVSIAGIWGMLANMPWPLYMIPRGTLADYALALVILLGIGITGLATFPFGIFTERMDDYSLVREQGNVYRRAWKRLWTQRWLLVVFGMVAVVNWLGNVLETIYTYALIRSHGGALPPFSAPSFLQVLYTLPEHLRSIACNTPRYLSPDPGFTRTMVVTPFVMAIGVSLLLFYLRRRTVEGKGAEEVRDRSSLWVLLALSLAAGVFSVFLYRQYMSIKFMGLPGLMVFAGGIVSILVNAAANGFFMSGLAGSLKRSQDGGTVTLGSFAEDSIRFWKPMLGVYLFLWLVGEVLNPGNVISLLAFSRAAEAAMRHESLASIGRFWQLFMLLFAFVPYAVVLRRPEVRASLTSGISDLVSNVKDTLAFLALGASFLTVFGLAAAPLYGWVRHPSFLLRYMPLGTMIQTLATAFAAVALWEFYVCIVRNEEQEDMADTDSKNVDMNDADVILHQ